MWTLVEPWPGTSGGIHHRWLPGTHTLLVLSDRRLARVDFDATPPQQQLPVQWTQLGEMAPREPLHGLPSIQLVPGAAAALLMLCRWHPDGAQGRAEITFAAYDTCSLECLGTWQREPQHGDPPEGCVLTHRSMCVAPGCIVASFSYIGTWVWDWHGASQELGALRFGAPQLGRASCSPCGAFICGLLGVPSAQAHQVLCARTGALLVHVDPPYSSFPARALRVVWGGPRANQLHGVWEVQKRRGGVHTMIYSILQL